MRIIKNVGLLMGLFLLTGCASIKDFSSWVSPDASPIEGLQVLVLGASYADADRFERTICDQVHTSQAQISCRPITNVFPPSVDIDSSKVVSEFISSEASHILIVSLLSTTSKTQYFTQNVNNQAVTSSSSHDTNTHTLSLLQKDVEDIVYSAELISGNEMSGAGQLYYSSLARNILRDLIDKGFI